MLQRFGLSNYKRSQHAPEHAGYAILADDGTWSLLADDWSYTLWHMPSTRPAIKKLAAHHDMFACSIGDCDRSFDFVYYQDAKLVREYVVEDPHYSGGSVVQNFGEPLSAESDIFKSTDDELEIVMRLAASLGIKTEYKEDDLRIYWRVDGD